jgi:hypothetical protein
MMPNDDHSTPISSLQVAQLAAYYCRGCGKPLPAGSAAKFHTECLKADKRRRITERRARETQRFQGWLRRRKCARCGARLENPTAISPRVPVEVPCEASQRAAERLNSEERPYGQEAVTEPAAQL